MVCGWLSSCSTKSSLVRLRTMAPCLSRTVASTFTNFDSTAISAFCWPLAGFIKNTGQSSETRKSPSHKLGLRPFLRWLDFIFIWSRREFAGATMRSSMRSPYREFSTDSPAAAPVVQAEEGCPRVSALVLRLHPCVQQEDADRSAQRHCLAACRWFGIAQAADAVPASECPSSPAGYQSPLFPMPSALR